MFIEIHLHIQTEVLCAGMEPGPLRVHFCLHNLLTRTICMGEVNSHSALVQVRGTFDLVRDLVITLRSAYLEEVEEDGAQQPRLASCFPW